MPGSALLQENQRIKNMLSSGEKEYKDAIKDRAKAQLKSAKEAYKQALNAKG